MKQLAPIFICGIMPIAIVLITSWVKMNRENKRAEIIIKAIEANNCVDADKLAESLSRPHKSAREVRNSRLLCGCIFTLLGLFGIVCALFNYAAGLWVETDYVTFLLIAGGASLAIGISYLIVYHVTGKQPDSDSL